MRILGHKTDRGQHQVRMDPHRLSCSRQRVIEEDIYNGNRSVSGTSTSSSSYVLSNNMHLQASLCPQQHHYMGHGGYHDPYGATTAPPHHQHMMHAEPSMVAAQQQRKFKTIKHVIVEFQGVWKCISCGVLGFVVSVKLHVAP